VPHGINLTRAAAGILAVVFGVIHSRLAHGIGGPDHGLSAARSAAVYLRGLGAAIDAEP
jgi:hypothetical protein